MNGLDFSNIDLLWAGALTSIPVAIVAALVCLCVRRPATRHALWVVVSASFLMPALAAMIGTPRLVERRDVREWHDQAQRFAARSLIESASTGALGGGEVIDCQEVRGDDTTDALVALDGRASAPSDRLNQAEPLPGPPAVRPSVLRSERSQARERSVRVPARDVSERLAREPRGQHTLSPRGSQRRTERSQRSRVEPERSVVVWPESSTAVRPDRVSGRSRLPVVTEPFVASEEPEDRAVGASAAQPFSSESSGVEDEVESDGPTPVEAEQPAFRFDVLWLTARAWFESVIERVGAIGSLPPPPAWLWSIGVIGIGVLALARRVVSSRTIRRGEEAPEWVMALVRQAGARVGLARLPRVLMVRGAVSPMVTCGWRPVLLLPVELFGALDVRSRDAVLVHELAHLKRLDHRVRWLESAVGALYWWHPVVWWARRRLRDEAGCVVTRG